MKKYNGNIIKFAIGRRLSAMSSRVARLAVWGLCLGVLAGADPDLVVDLTLVDALSRTNRSGVAERAGAILSVRRVDGRWQPVAVMPRGFNSNYGVGFVESAQIGPQHIDLVVAASIADDPWIAGGWGRWTIGLERQADGVWRGRHAGRFMADEVAGEVAGEVAEQDARAVPACAPGEHPRLLLRRADIPALRERLATPFGQAAAARMTNAPGLALRAAITGDAALAEAAMTAVGALIADSSNGSKHVAHRVWAWRLQAVAIAYDCCGDRWPEAFRAQVRAWIGRVVGRILYQHQNWTEYTGWSLGHRFGMNFIGAAALGTLAVVGDPGPGPAPVATAERDLQVAVPTVPITASVPRQALEPGRIPERWLFAGGMPADVAASVAAALGGPAAPVLADGCPAAAGVAFAPLPAGGIHDGAIDVVKANKRAYYTGNWLATALTVSPAQDGWFRFDAGCDAGVTDWSAWISGVPLRDGEILRLAPGDHLLLMSCVVGETNAWGMIGIRPRLVAVTAEQAAAGRALNDWVAGLAGAERSRLADWHAATGGDAALWRDAALAEGLAHIVLRQMVGRGGFQTGLRDHLFVLEGLIRFALPYRIANGRPLAPTRDIDDYLPRLLFSQTISPGGWASQPINGRCDLMVKEWFDPERDAAPELFACLAPLAERTLVPGLRGLWDRRLAVADPANPVEVLSSRLGSDRHGVDVGATDVHACFALVAYPLTTPAAPQAAAWPTSWRAEDQGWYAVRSGYAGPDDALVQVHAKAKPSAGWDRENAGVLRVRALGHDWWGGPADSTADRFLESTPIPMQGSLPSPDACGAVIHAETGTTGLNVVMDLGGLYTSSEAADGEAKPAMVGPGMRQRPSAQPAAVRTVAADVSGRCGAPVLLVIRDRVVGHGQQRWRHLLQAETQRVGRWDVVDAAGKLVRDAQAKRRCLVEGLPAGYAFRDSVPMTGAGPVAPTAGVEVTIDGNRFTIARGDATMTGLVLTDGPCTVRRETGERFERLWFAKGNHVIDRMRSDAVVAEGASDYLVVMTIQRGPPPAMTASGAGMAAVRVGRLTVAVDGDRVAIGE